MLVVAQHLRGGMAHQLQLVFIRCGDCLQEGREAMPAAVRGQLPRGAVRGVQGQPHGFQGIVELVPVLFVGEGLSVAVAEDGAGPSAA